MAHRLALTMSSHFCKPSQTRCLVIARFLSCLSRSRELVAHDRNERDLPRQKLKFGISPRIPIFKLLELWKTILACFLDPSRGEPRSG
ncbi:hypothetical protein H5410_015439 [Solanum commersonii]|uniref:Uncharacterized protein n=1 Tax=Solanum commersonii TaxID=4109 RepID=A0A9J5ZUI0_SOLCO|nr:hypothetical protein H5410_015439 [Solanum commersonii]